MSTHVHFLHSRSEFFYTPSGAEKDILEQHLQPDVKVTWGDDVPETAVILIGGRPSREQLSSPQVQSLIIPWAGLPAETRALLPEFPHLTVHNLHHNAAPVAELASSLLLAAAKLIIPYDQGLRGHDWRLRYSTRKAVYLGGKTALILGYGAIGQRVARMCQSLDMHVIATRRSPTPDENGVEIHSPDALPDLLPRSQALIICLPHTSETDGLIGARELALLPPDSVLVNIGRGPIVDEAALYQALRNGRLHAAGLDVWYNYPTDIAGRANTQPANFPFHELDNVVMSPHRGGQTLDSDWLRMTHLADLLNHAARGEPLPNRIDLGRGY